MAACVFVFSVTIISAGCVIGWFAISAVASQKDAIEAANVAHETLAGSLLRQAFSAEREHHTRLSRDLLRQRDDVLIRLDGRLATTVVKSESLAIRALRAKARRGLFGMAESERVDHCCSSRFHSGYGDHGKPEWSSLCSYDGIGAVKTASQFSL